MDIWQSIFLMIKTKTSYYNVINQLSLWRIQNMIFKEMNDIF